MDSETARFSTLHLQYRQASTRPGSRVACLYRRPTEFGCTTDPKIKGHLKLVPRCAIRDICHRVAAARRNLGICRCTVIVSAPYPYYSYSCIAQSEVFQSPSTKTQGMFVSKSVSSANEIPTVPLPLSTSTVTSVTVRGAD